MKHSFLVLLIAFVAVSCTKSEKSEVKFPQKWTLVNVTGQMQKAVTNSDITGSLPWQQSYTFNSDGSFIKQRVKDGIEYEATGRYTIVKRYVNEKNMTYLELTFDSNSPLIEGCYGGASREVLWLQSDNKLVNTWSECDGMGLEYELEN